ncbi:hypothetical protein D7193_15880 [Micromonospora costi]|uniref:Uncharacterized protein n=1 Tax=Micromonospora costi TaxID=1530042 RepID=A0A3B0A6P3_9ACTN|nr:hypothetical protein D7193_15880 [Micromonospora costi]
MLLLGVAAGLGTLIALGHSEDAHAADSTPYPTADHIGDVEPARAALAGIKSHPRAVATQPVRRLIETTAAIEGTTVRPTINRLVGDTVSARIRLLDAAPREPAFVRARPQAPPPPAADPRHAPAKTQPAPARARVKPAGTLHLAGHRRPAAAHPPAEGAARRLPPPVPHAAALTPGDSGSHSHWINSVSSDDAATAPAAKPFDATTTGVWTPHSLPDRPLRGRDQHHDGRTHPPSPPFG